MVASGGGTVKIKVSLELANPSALANSISKAVRQGLKSGMSSMSIPAPKLSRGGRLDPLSRPSIKDIRNKESTSLRKSIDTLSSQLSENEKRLKRGEKLLKDTQKSSVKESLKSNVNQIKRNNKQLSELKSQLVGAERSAKAREKKALSLPEIAPGAITSKRPKAVSITPTQRLAADQKTLAARRRFEEALGSFSPKKLKELKKGLTEKDIIRSFRARDPLKDLAPALEAGQLKLPTIARAIDKKMTSFEKEIQKTRKAELARETFKGKIDKSISKEASLKNVSQTIGQMTDAQASFFQRQIAKGKPIQAFEALGFKQISKDLETGLLPISSISRRLDSDIKRRSSLKEKSEKEIRAEADRRQRDLERSQLKRTKESLSGQFSKEELDFIRRSSEKGRASSAFRTLGKADIADALDSGRIKQADIDRLKPRESMRPLQPPRGPTGPRLPGGLGGPGSGGPGRGGLFQGGTLGGGKGLTGRLQSVAEFTIAARLVGSAFDTLGKSISTITKTNTEIAELSKVLDLSAESANRLQTSAINIGRAFGQSIPEVLSNFKIFAQQGLPIDQIEKRAKAVAISANVTTLSQAEAAETITAGLKVFENEIQDPIKLIDKLTAVESRNAVTAGDLAKAILRTGAAARTAGLSLDELNSVVTIIQERTRKGGKEIGTSLRFILRKLFSKDSLNSLEEYGVQTKETTGELRGAFDIISDLSKVFPNLTRQQKLNVAQATAGSRRYNDFISLLEGFDKAGEVVTQSQDSQGSSFEKNERILESLSKQVDKTVASFEAFAITSGQSLVGPFTTILKISQKVLDTMTSLASLNFSNIAEMFGIGGADQGPRGFLESRSKPQGIAAELGLDSVGGIVSTVVAASVAKAIGGAALGTKLGKTLSDVLKKGLGSVIALRSSPAAVGLSTVGSAAAMAGGGAAVSLSTFSSGLVAAALALGKLLLPLVAIIAAFKGLEFVIGRLTETTEQRAQRLGITGRQQEAREDLDLARTIKKDVESIFDPNTGVNQKIKKAEEEALKFARDRAKDPTLQLSREELMKASKSMAEEFGEESLGDIIKQRDDSIKTILKNLSKVSPEDFDFTIEGPKPKFDLSELSERAQEAFKKANLKQVEAEAEKVSLSFVSGVSNMSEEAAKALKAASKTINTPKLTKEFGPEFIRAAIEKSNIEATTIRRGESEAFTGEGGEELSRVIAPVLKLLEKDLRAGGRGALAARTLAGIGREPINKIAPFIGMTDEKLKLPHEEFIREAVGSLSKFLISQESAGPVVEGKPSKFAERAFSDINKAAETGIKALDINEVKEQARSQGKDVREALKSSIKDRRRIIVEEESGVKHVARVFENLDGTFSVLAESTESSSTMLKSLSDVLDLLAGNVKGLIVDSSELSQKLRDSVDPDIITTGVGRGIIDPFASNQPFPSAARSLTELGDTQAGLVTLNKTFGKSISNVNDFSEVIRDAAKERSRIVEQIKAESVGEDEVQSINALREKLNALDQAFSTVPAAIEGLGRAAKIAASNLESLGRRVVSRAVERAFPILQRDALGGAGLPSIARGVKEEDLTAEQLAFRRNPELRESLSMIQQEMGVRQENIAAIVNERESFLKFFSTATPEDLGRIDSKKFSSLLEGSGLGEASRDSLLKDIFSFEAAAKEQGRVGANREQIQDLGSLFTSTFFDKLLRKEVQSFENLQGSAMSLEQLNSANEAIASLAKSAMSSAKALEELAESPDRRNVQAALGQGTFGRLGERAPSVFVAREGNSAGRFEDLSNLNQFEAERRRIQLLSQPSVRSGSFNVFDTQGNRIDPLNREQSRQQMSFLKFRERLARREQQREPAERELQVRADQTAQALTQVRQVLRSGDVTDPQQKRRLEDFASRLERDFTQDPKSLIQGDRVRGFQTIDELPKIAEDLNIPLGTLEQLGVRRNEILQKSSELLEKLVNIQEKSQQDRGKTPSQQQASNFSNPVIPISKNMDGISNILPTGVVSPKAITTDKTGLTSQGLVPTLRLARGLGPFDTKLPDSSTKPFINKMTNFLLNKAPDAGVLLDRGVEVPESLKTSEASILMRQTKTGESYNEARRSIIEAQGSITSNNTPFSNFENTKLKFKEELGRKIITGIQDADNVISPQVGRTNINKAIDAETRIRTGNDNAYPGGAIAADIDRPTPPEKRRLRDVTEAVNTGDRLPQVTSLETRRPETQTPRELDLNSVQNNLNSLTEALSNLVTNINPVNESLGELADSAADINTTIGSFGSSLSEADTNLQSLVSSSSNASSSLSNFSSEVSQINLNNGGASLGGGIGAQRLQDIQDLLTTLTKQDIEKDIKIIQLEQRQVQLESELDDNTSSISEFSASLKSLSFEISQSSQESNRALTEATKAQTGITDINNKITKVEAKAEEARGLANLAQSIASSALTNRI